MLKRILCNLFNLTPIEKLWREESKNSHRQVRIDLLESKNLNLSANILSLEMENNRLRMQAEEAVKDMAIQTGEILSLKNQLAYVKCELSMRNYE